MTSNRQIRSILFNTDPYKSRFTGEDVDKAVENARNLPEYMEKNVQIPYVNFTGDLLEVPINTFQHRTWLHAVVIDVVSAFSKSTPKYSYEIVADGRNIVTIPATAMMKPNATTTFVVNTIIEPGETVSMIANSTNAFGDLRIKLIVS